MIEKFLSAKHWQLFLVLFGAPVLIHLTFIAFLVQGVVGDSPSEIVIINYLTLVYPIVGLVFLSGYYGWIWSVATGLLSKIPPMIDMKVKYFKIFFFIPLIYLISFIALLLFFTNGGLDLLSPKNLESTIYLLIIIVPIHLIAMFCNFYIVYHLAKTIKTAELQRSVKFSEFIEEFLLILFFPFGIWFIQPRVNALHKGTVID